MPAHGEFAGFRQLDLLEHVSRSPVGSAAHGHDERGDAAGDVAELVDIARDCRWVNALWPEAASQGRVAGLNMAGRPVAYPGSLSRNVMRVYDLDVLTVGYANPPEAEGYRIFQKGGAAHRYYRQLVFKDDCLVGAVMINRIEQGGVLRSLIENRVPIDLPPETLMEPGFNFGRLIS